MEVLTNKNKSKQKQKKFIKQNNTFFKGEEMVEATVLEIKNKVAYFDLGKSTGIVFGKEYLEAKNTIRKLKPGDKVTVKIIEINGEDGYIEVSLKEAYQNFQGETIKNIQEQGKTVGAKVIGANRGGLLLKFGGFSGFLPTSQMSKEHFPKGKTDQEILDQLQKFIGQTLEVKIYNYLAKQRGLIFTEK